MEEAQRLDDLGCGRVARIRRDPLEQNVVGEALQLAEGVAQPALQRLLAQRRDCAKGGRPAARSG